MGKTQAKPQLWSHKEKEKVLKCEMIKRALVCLFLPVGEQDTNMNVEPCVNPPRPTSHMQTSQGSSDNRS